MENIAELFKSQKLFFASGHTYAVSWRHEQLTKLKRMLQDNTDAILDCLFDDLRKPAYEAYTSEIGVVLAEIDHALKNLAKWTKPQKIHTPLINTPSTGMHYAVPYGSVLIIGPWNYPVLLLLQPLVASLAAGNCAVLKPSEHAQTTGKFLYKIIKETFSPEVVSCFLGDAQKTVNAIEYGRPDKVFFTGGTTTGQKVMTQCAVHLIPVVLELGGCCPCIVEADAEIEVSARRVIWGKFFNAGQTCIAPNNCYVHSSIIDDFMNALCRIINEFYGSNPKQSPNYARIINENHYERIRALYASTDLKPVKGGDFDRNDYYISPTIFRVEPGVSNPFTEEIFGPILPVIIYENIDNILTEIGRQSKPLAVYLFTKSKELIKQVRIKTVSGNFCVNSTLQMMLCNELPFGGIGQSGIGRYHGRAGFENLSYRRAEFKKPFNPDFRSFMYPPYKIPLGFVRKVFSLLMK
ncbi:MAG: aldehyde dehydrogenase family protein [Fibrobacter sp.]|nr:aldehyde dehydrogenase family protein [Fibrobacter sp.]